MVFKSGRSDYRIVVENPQGVSRGVVLLEVDGVEQTGRDVAMLDDGAVHHVRVVLGGPDRKFEV